MSTRLLAMNIAVIGTNEAAQIYAAHFAIAGHEVYYACKEPEKRSENPVFEILENLYCCSIEEASAAADIIFIATAPKDVREVAYWLGDVRGKVVIDMTSNFIANNDDYVNTVGAIKAITGSSNIVKVFCTKGYEQLLRPLLKNDKVHIVLMGEKQKARQVVKIMARDLDIHSFIDLGGFESVHLFDSLTQCWHDLSKKARDANAGKATVNH